MALWFILRVSTDLLFCVIVIHNLICVIILANGYVVGFRFGGWSDTELILLLDESVVGNMNYMTFGFRQNVQSDPVDVVPPKVVFRRRLL